MLKLNKYIVGLVMCVMTFCLFGQESSAILSRMGIRGATGTGGTTNFYKYLPYLDAAGRLSSSMMSTSVFLTDGSVPMTAPLNMGGFNITNLASGTSSLMGVNVGQLNASNSLWFTSSTNSTIQYVLGLNYVTASITNGILSSANSYTDGATNGVLISAKAYADSCTNGIALGSGDFKSDGTVAMAAPLNAGGFNITNLLAGTSSLMGVNVGQLNASNSLWFTSSTNSVIQYIVGLGYTTRAYVDGATNGLYSTITGLGYVTASITNGILTSARSYTDGATNSLYSTITGLGYVTSSITNGILTSANSYTDGATNGVLVTAKAYADSCTNGIVGGSFSLSVGPSNYTSHVVFIAGSGVTFTPSGGITNTISAPGGGTGDLKSDGTVAMIAPFNAGGFNITNLLAGTSSLMGVNVGQLNASNSLWFTSSTNSAIQYIVGLGYVTSSITNGLASTGYVTGQGYVTQTITNGILTSAHSYTDSATNGVFTLSTNSSIQYILGLNYVTSSITNSLASTGYVTGQGYVTASITNGILSSAHSYTDSATNGLYSTITGLGYVTASITNSLASTGYVTGQGYVTASITNGILSSAHSYTDSATNAVLVTAKSYADSCTNGIVGGLGATTLTNITSATATITGQGTHVLNIEVSSSGGGVATNNVDWIATSGPNFFNVSDLCTNNVAAYITYPRGGVVPAGSTAYIKSLKIRNGGGSPTTISIKVADQSGFDDPEMFYQTLAANSSITYNDIGVCYVATISSAGTNNFNCSYVLATNAVWTTEHHTLTNNVDVLVFPAPASRTRINSLVIHNGNSYAGTFSLYHVNSIGGLTNTIESGYTLAPRSNYSLEDYYINTNDFIYATAGTNTMSSHVIYQIR